eukprot:332825_1
MPTYLTVLIIYLINIRFIESQWRIDKTSTMPSAPSYGSIGYYNNTISIIGGSSLMQYHLNSDLFTYNSTYFVAIPPYSLNLHASAQWWTQIENKLYFTGHNSGNIGIFDLTTNQYILDWGSIPISSGYFYSCFTGKYNYLYMVGTGPHSNTFITFYISNIENMLWTIGPSLNQPRGWLACTISNNDKLYAIAGSKPTGGRLTSIEYIDVNNINSWSFTQNELTGSGLEAPRAVVYSDFIFVLGGFTGYNYPKFVHIIDTITNKVTLSTEELVLGVSGIIPIVVNQSIYAFGGYNNIQSNDKCQWFSLLTDSPTSDPISNKISYICANTISNKIHIRSNHHRSNTFSNQESYICTYTISNKISYICANTISNKISNQESYICANRKSYTCTYTISNKISYICANTISNKISNQESYICANRKSYTCTYTISNKISYK